MPAAGRSYIDPWCESYWVSRSFSGLADALNSPAMQRLKRKDLKDQQVERAWNQASRFSHADALLSAIMHFSLDPSQLFRKARNLQSLPLNTA